MCDDNDDGGYIKGFTEQWRKARKAHECEACREPIAPRTRYHYCSGISDGYAFSMKHCARCWTVYEALRKAKPRDAINIALDCGTVWEDPPDDIAALAFALPSDFAEAG